MILPFLLVPHPVTGRLWLSIGHTAMAHRARYGGRRFVIPLVRGTL